MGRFSRSVALVKTSWSVLKSDKKLILFPLLSGAATLVVGLTFIVPLAIADMTFFEDPGPAQYAVGFLFYLVLAFITIFFNSALVHAVNERLDGGTPTVASGLRAAWSRVGSIFAWALVAATVSVVLRAIEEKVGVVGRIIVSIFGLAWSLITFLVIPVLVVEGVGVRDAISRSSEMFRRTWGENVLAQVGIGLIAFLLVIPGVVLIAIGGGSGSEGMLLTMVAVAMLWFILLALVMAALNGIFQTALYRYAAGMPVGGAFDGDVLSNAFAPRKS